MKSTPENLEIANFPNWTISHRTDSRYSGFLIVSSKESVENISDLSSESLSELGDVLAKVENLLIRYCNPYRVITSKLGFTSGYSCHFHILPVTEELLGEIVEHPNYTDEPDGNDALLFASREYCERPLTSEEIEVQLNSVCQLRRFFNENELTFYIREAVIDDISVISDLVTILSTKFILPSLSEKGSDKLIQSMKAESINGYIQKGYRYHVGIVQEEIVAVISTRDNCHLYHLFVREDHQGNGYASRLWDVALKACVEAGSPNYFTVNSSLNAQHIYKKWGFVPISRIRETSGIKDIPMKLELD